MPPRISNFVKVATVFLGIAGVRKKNEEPHHIFPYIPATPNEPLFHLLNNQINCMLLRMFTISKNASFLEALNKKWPPQNGETTFELRPSGTRTTREWLLSNYPGLSKDQSRPGRWRRYCR